MDEDLDAEGLRIATSCAERVLPSAATRPSAAGMTNRMREFCEVWGSVSAGEATHSGFDTGPYGRVGTFVSRLPPVALRAHLSPVP